MSHLERPPDVQPAVLGKGTQSTACCRIKCLQDKMPATPGASAASVSISDILYLVLFIQPLKDGLINSERVPDLLLGKDDGLN